MTAELYALAALAFVHFATIMVAQRVLTRDVGIEGNMGTREGVEQRLSPLAQRLRRASANFTENLGPFLIAVVIVVLAQKTSTFTALAAWIYVAARILYVPAYALGWQPGRSIIWSIGAAATAALLIAGLIP